MNLKYIIFYKKYSPVIWMFVGAMCILTGLMIEDEIKGNFNLETFYLDVTGQSSSYKTNDGKFACWWIDEVMRTPDYDNLGNYEKEIFQVSKKYCVEIPRP